MNKKNTFSLISLAISLTLIFVFILPLFSLVKAMYSDLDIKNQEIEALKELSEKIEKIQGSYDSISEAVEKILVTVPKEKDLPQLLVQFEKLALNNGLLLKLMRFGEIEEKTEKDFIRNVNDYETLNQSEKVLSSFPSLPVLIKVVGSYSAFKNYIISLEKSVRSMDIYLINFSSSNQTLNLLGNSGIFEFNLGVNVYYE